MKRSVIKPIEWLPILFFLAIVGLVFYLAATSLAEQGAASGTAITNAAMYPRLIAGLLLLLIIVQLISSIRKQHLKSKLTSEQSMNIHDGEESGSRDVKQIRRQIMLSSAAFVAYLLVLPIFGYLLATHILIIALVLILGVRSIIRVFSFSVVLTFVCAIVFEGLLNVHLPRGIWGLAISF
jgi:hypothetical protein